LLQNKFIEDIPHFDAEALKVYSGDVLGKIQAADESLAQVIPAPIYEVIKAKRLFGWGRNAAAVAA
jgi:hypothetical protein